MSSGITKIGDETSSKTSITLFGIPIIQTKCQGDAHFYGIVGGITCGLVSYLFTSKARISSHIGVGCYAVTTLCYAYYCMNQNYKMTKQMRLMQKAMYEADSMRSVNKKDELSEHKLETI